MIAGNLLQQIYNIADTLIVGRFVGANALAAVGFAYTLAPNISLGVTAIWLAIPIGWGLADLTGSGVFLFLQRKRTVRPGIADRM